MDAIEINVRELPAKIFSKITSGIRSVINFVIRSLPSLIICGIAMYTYAKFGFEKTALGLLLTIALMILHKK